MNIFPLPPLEDELGDVLEKAMHRAGLTDESLAARTGVRAGRILDAIDYRSDLTTDELRLLAASPWWSCWLLSPSSGFWWDCWRREFPGRWMRE